MTISDETLIISYKETGDQKYVGELFNRYIPLVFGVCLKYINDKDDAKDIVMQVFEKLMVALLKHEVLNFRSWLLTVTKNCCLDAIRKRKEVELNEYKKIESENCETQKEKLEARIEKENMLDLLPLAIDKLGEEQKICITLFYLKQNSYEDISRLTGFDLNKVKSYIQNGKRNLKTLLLTRHERGI